MPDEFACRAVRSASPPLTNWLYCPMKPSVKPLSVTTEASPIAMPRIVNAVRVRRRHSERSRLDRMCRSPQR